MIKKLNEKSKWEQLFVLMLIFSAVIGLFCINGCGGRSCETPACGSKNFGSGSAVGCSIPGCGGILTSGKGCDAACWPQSCKVVHGSSNEKNEETGEKDSLSVTACDTRYYGDGCLGCGQQEKSCYSGCIKLEDSDEDTDVNGFFYGSSDSEEKIVGCYNGCGGCVGSGGTGKMTIFDLENLTGVN